MIPTTNILITGTRKGIGLALLQAYAALPNHTIIAAINYAPSSPEARTMLSICPLAQNTIIIPIAYDAALLTSAATLVSNLPPSITHIDIIIANAAINESSAVATQSLDQLDQHLRINAIAPLALFQATRSLLLAAARPRYIYMSSTAASMSASRGLPFPIVTVAMSKAAGNAFIVQADGEEERIAFVAVHPGWVQSEKGNLIARMLGLEKAPMEMGECVGKMMALVEGMTKEGMGGRFVDENQVDVPW